MSTKVLELHDAPAAQREATTQRGLELAQDSKIMTIAYIDGQMTVMNAGDTGLNAPYRIFGSKDGDWLFISDSGKSRTFAMVTSLEVMREVTNIVGGHIGMPPVSPEAGESYRVHVREVTHMPVESQDYVGGTIAIEMGGSAQRVSKVVEDEALPETVAIDIADLPKPPKLKSTLEYGRRLPPTPRSVETAASTVQEIQPRPSENSLTLASQVAITRTRIALFLAALAAAGAIGYYTAPKDGEKDTEEQPVVDIQK